MGRWQKTVKKYERHLLLGLVILLLVSFSVTGAISCTQEGAEERDWGGDFLLTSSKRGDLSNNDFLGMMRRVDPLRYNIGSSSLRFFPGMYGVRELSGWEGAWAHALPVEAAKYAGYRCGEKFQLPTAIRRAVQGAMGGMEFNNATYDKFLRDFYRRGSVDFQETIREVAMKDAFLRPLIETPRYGIPYAEAYEVWKRLLQRVRLDYIALRGADFELAALQQEKTRERISLQEDLLQKVSNTARSLDGLRTRLESWRDAKVEEERARRKAAGEDVEGVEIAVAWPESLEALGGAVPTKDAWEHDLRYAVDGSSFDLRSAGPDGSFDSSDDVTRETAAQLATRAALREAGDALLRWHEATEAWPASLEAMRESPKEGTLAPLKQEVKDGWDRALVLEAGADGAAPRLFSLGADGAAGTDDDVAAGVDVAAVLVGPGIAFIPYLVAEDRDAWDRAMQVDFAFPISWGWRVTSAGADGAFGTDDDVKEGNRAEIERFFRRPEVQSDYSEPTRRELEALYVHLPLVPDEVLEVLWDKYPQYRPGNEVTDAFDDWRQKRNYVYYMAEDPADPVAGHGAALAKEVAPDATPTLVPDATIFGEPPPELKEEGNPDKAEYLEKGWRPIVLREQFFERLMADLLRQARESREAVQQWEAKKTAFDAGGGEDPGARPAELTFPGLMATAFADVLPAEGKAPWIGHYVSDRPLERSEWETLASIGDLNLTTNLQRVTEDGQYADIPYVLKDSHTRAILRNVKYYATRMKTLDEVYDDVFARYVKEKRLDIAEAKLRDLRDRAKLAAVTTSPAPGEDGAEEGADAPKDPLREAVAAWAEENGFAYLLEDTGWFIGARPPAARKPGDAVPEEKRSFLARRDYVRTTGYETIRATTATGEDLPKGALGREVLRDDDAEGTDSVYLVRLAEVRFPPPEAFSPRDYADYLTAEILGGPKGGYGMGAAAGGQRVDMGVIRAGIQDFFGDFDYLKRKFDLKPRYAPEASR